MSWRFLVLMFLAFTISLGRESLSSYAEPVAQSSTQVAPKLAQAYLDYYNRAVEKQNRGDNYGAISDCNEAIRLNPNFAEAYSVRGNAKSNLGDNQGAIADYKEAIRIKPYYAEAHYGLGRAKYLLGDNQGAISDSNEAIRLKPNYAEAYTIRGNAKSLTGDKYGALADFRRAAQLFQQQGNTEWYQNVLKGIEEIERSL